MEHRLNWRRHVYPLYSAMVAVLAALPIVLFISALVKLRWGVYYDGWVMFVLVVVLALIIELIDHGLQPQLTMARLWRPIAELEDRYAGNLLLQAPELVDLDCNEPGVGMGYWQDGARPHGEGTWLAARWNMSNDEWYEVECCPTHFMVIEGVLGVPVPSHEEVYR